MLISNQGAVKMKAIRLIFTLVLICFWLSAEALAELDIQMGSAQFVKELSVSNNKLSHILDLASSPKLMVSYSIPESVTLKNIQIVLSDGTIVTTDNMEDFGVTIDSSNFLERFLFPASNSLMLIFDNTPSKATEIKGDFIGSTINSIVTNIKAINSEMLFGTGITPSRIYPNDTIYLHHLITEGVSPPSTLANVSVDVFQNGELIHQLPLKDNGDRIVDYAAADGMYGGNLPLSQSGKYIFEITSIAVDTNGHAHKNKETKTVTVLPTPEYVVEPNFTEELIDTNNNGLADILRLTFTSQSTISEGTEFKVRVRIGSGDKVYGLEKVRVDRNNQNLVFDFDGKEIWNMHDSGPIEINALAIYKNGDLTPIFTTRAFGQTANSYLKSQFERDKEYIYQKTADVSLVDSNGDNFFEGINISFEADILESGGYKVKLSLFNENNEELFFQGRQNLIAGTNTFNLFIPAIEIVEKGFNGPAEIQEFMFFRYDDDEFSMINKLTFGVTPNFSYRNFEKSKKSTGK